MPTTVTRATIDNRGTSEGNGVTPGEIRENICENSSNFALMWTSSALISRRQTLVVLFLLNTMTQR